jgi:putative membrane protein
MRTILAADRTLMAWIRTALSMMSFGFTIYKFLDAAAKGGALERSDSPQRVGLLLVGMGIAAMVLGTGGYWMTLRDLMRIEEFRLGRPVLIMALIMTCLGIGLFVTIAGHLV